MSDRDERRSAAVRHFQQHPEDYLEKVQGARPDPIQLPVLRACAKPRARVCIVGGNGVGKDFISAGITEWFLYCFGTREDPAVVPTTSASGRQVGLLWNEINYWSAKSRASKAFDLLQRKMSLKDPALKDSYAVGFKAANEQVMEGFHASKLFYILTEARGMPDWGFNAMLKACSEYDNRILIQSVPGEETGEFYNIAKGNRAGWDVFFLPAAKKVGEREYIPTTPLISQESIDEKLQFGEDSPWFVAPVLAQFITGSSLNIVSLGDYLAAENRYGELESGPPDVLGVDVAWVGQNFTSLCHRRGSNLEKYTRYQGVRTPETARICIEWLVKYPHGKMVIESGIAQSGVIDRIEESGLGDRMVLVNPGGPPVGDPEQFADRRSELYYYFKERFKNGTIAVAERNSPLGGQITSIRAKVRGDMKFQIESKKEMAGHGMASPDDADAGMLTMAVASEGEAVEGDLDDIAVGGAELPELEW